MSENTERLYAAAEESFDLWRRVRGLRHPVRPENIADYLRVVRKERGPFSVPQHLSAIARSYRQKGWAVDTKTEVIQRVVKAARKKMKEP